MRLGALVLLYVAQGVASLALQSGGARQPARALQVSGNSNLLVRNDDLTQNSPQSGALPNNVSKNRSGPPSSKVPDTVEQKSPWPGNKRKKIRYGPYRVPPTSERNPESEAFNVEGLISQTIMGVKKPCDSGCVILNAAASAEWEDGRPVKHTDVWLHHAVLVKDGPGVRDIVCQNETMEYVFESGNERSEVAFFVPNSTVSTGYFLRPAERFILNTEFMNMEDKEKWVWLTLTYDYVEGIPSAYKDARVVWMSIGPNRCGGSAKNPFGTTNVTATQQPLKSVFSEYSFPWTSPHDGWVFGGNGHVHDGGVSIEIFKNDQVICTSVPHYSTTATGAMGGMKKRQLMGTAANNTQIEHVGVQEGCTFNPPLPIKKGDTMHIKANYDFTKHPGMKNKKGELDAIMGIVGSLVAFNNPL